MPPAQCTEIRYEDPVLGFIRQAWIFACFEAQSLRISTWAKLEKKFKKKHGTSEAAARK
jgi:hypothetical protein